MRAALRSEESAFSQEDFFNALHPTAIRHTARMRFLTTSLDTSQLRYNQRNVIFCIVTPPIQPLGGKKYMRARLFFVAILSALLLPNAVGQTTGSEADIGLQQYHEYHGGDIDHINLDNGNLTLTIPILSYPQRGSALKADFAIVYNGTGRTWQAAGECIPTVTDGLVCPYGWIPTKHSYTGMALTPVDISASPALFDMQNVTLGENLLTLNGTVGPATFLQYDWLTADGASHVAGNTSGGQVALDGSGFQAGWIEQAGAPGSTNTCIWDCSLPSVVPSPYLVGTRGGITWIQSGGTTSTGGSARIDADGNYILYTETSILDTVGRNIPFPTVNTAPTAAQTAVCQGPLSPIVAVATWTPPGFTEPYTFCYVNVTLSMWKQGIENLVLYPTELMLQSIVQPNGQAWIFEYTESISCQGAGTNLGDLTHITFPTGGTIDYQYTCFASPVAGGGSSTAVSERTVNANDGTGAHSWQYSYSNTTAGAVTTVTDPAPSLNQHVHSVFTIENPALRTPSKNRQVLFRQCYVWKAAAH